MNDNERYTSEFRELGRDRVRSELLLRRWPKEKLSAARRWVEVEDALAWQAGRGDAPARSGAAWQKKWVAYGATAVGLLFAAARIIRILKRI